MYSVDSAGTETTSGRVAIGYATTNDFAVSSNGAAVGTDASGSIAGFALTDFYIGSLGAGAQRFNGWISSLSYYGTRLPNATLQSLST